MEHLGEAVRVEARPRNVRPVRRPRGCVVRLHRPFVGGRRYYRPEPPAHVPRLQAPRAPRRRIGGCHAVTSSLLPGVVFGISVHRVAHPTIGSCSTNRTFPSPANTALDWASSRRACYCWLWPGSGGTQEQAEAQSGSKATKPKTKRTIEESPVSSRVELITRSMPYSSTFLECAFSEVRGASTSRGTNTPLSMFDPLWRTGRLTTRVSKPTRKEGRLP
jgi:hypothetical protein